jgi:hypothetical protein
MPTSPPEQLPSMLSRCGHAFWGCPLPCALDVFQRHQREVAEHIRLHDHGVKKHVGLPADTTIETFVDGLPLAQEPALSVRAT